MQLHSNWVETSRSLSKYLPSSNSTMLVRDHHSTRMDTAARAHAVVQTLCWMECPTDKIHSVVLRGRIAFARRLPDCSWPLGRIECWMRLRSCFQLNLKPPSAEDLLSQGHTCDWPSAVVGIHHSISLHDLYATDDKRAHSWRALQPRDWCALLWHNCDTIQDLHLLGLCQCLMVERRVASDIQRRR